MHLRSTLPATLVAAALLLGSCSGSSDSGSSGAAKTTTTAKKATTTTAVKVPADAVATDAVKIADLAFSPKVVVIAAGESVTFTNDDTVAHTATSDEDASWDTGAIGPGDSLLIGFEEPGTYPYHCEYHASMTGTIVVTA